ncbi:MAG: FAD:protein FMN transferase [Calditrichaeota bacterium]|nr:FAD:protein FMN transferase [Calditrichota bacterium]
MNNPSDQIILSPNSSSLQNIQKFSHKAMATIFEIYINSDRYDYYAQAAQAAFIEIDRLETELSRFIENSDVSRINALKLNESAIVGPDVLNCLKMCADLYKNTEGLFDITAGSLYDSWKYSSNHQSGNNSNKSLFPWLYIDSESFTVKKVNENISIDLGGFGKGYALEIVKDILYEWGTKSFMLNGGMSTVLASEDHDWCISLSHPVSGKIIHEINLKGNALSGSGINKGQHIINPVSGEPVNDKIAAWAIAKNAAVSDALSTAFMLMPEDKIEEFCDKNEETGALIIENNELFTFKFFGEWG